MLLFQKFPYCKQNPREMIDGANSLKSINKVLSTIISQNILPKYLPDIVGRIGYILNTTDTNLLSQNDFCLIYNTLWEREKLTFKEETDIIALIRDIDQLLSSDIKFLKNNIHLYGYLPPSNNLCHQILALPKEENQKITRAYLSSYLNLIYQICDLKGLEYDRGLLSTFLYNLSLIDLMLFGDMSKPSIDFIISVKKKSKLIEFSDNEIKEKTLDTLCCALLYLYDIWNNPFSIGIEVLDAIYKDNEMQKREIEMDDLCRSIRCIYSDYYDYLDDLQLLAKNMHIILKDAWKYNKLQTSSFNLEYIRDSINKISIGYLSMYKKLPKKIYINSARILFERIVMNFEPARNQKDILMKTFDSVMNDLLNIKIDYSQESFFSLLGFSEDINDYSAMEASVLKDDKDAKVGREIDKRPREKNGRYKSAGKDIKSVGLSIGHAFKTFNDSKEQIENQMDKGFNALKDALFGTKKIRTTIVEGKKFSITSLFKKLIGLMCLFSFGKVKAILFLIVRAVNKGKITKAERRKIIMDIEEELELIEEKINDASADGDRKAKYSLMRSRAELKNALARIKYGYEAADDSKAVQQLRSKMD